MKLTEFSYKIKILLLIAIGIVALRLSIIGCFNYVGDANTRAFFIRLAGQ